MHNWTLIDVLFVLLIVLCLAVIAICSIVVVATKASRAKFVQLRNEVRQLSKEIKALQVAEQRRFLVELKSNGESKEPSVASSPRPRQFQRAVPRACKLSKIRKEA
jgi:competence protein ComGC